MKREVLTELSIWLILVEFRYKRFFHLIFCRNHSFSLLVDIHLRGLHFFFPHSLYFPIDLFYQRGYGFFSNLIHRLHSAVIVSSTNFLFGSIFFYLLTSPVQCAFFCLILAFRFFNSGMSVIILDT